MKEKEVVDSTSEYASEIESIISDLVYFLDREIPYPFKDYSLAELIRYADEFNSIIVNTQLDLSQLIREMKGAQLRD